MLSETRSYIGLFMLSAIMFLVSCGKNDESDKRVTYLYSGEILDAQTLQAKQEIVDEGTKQYTVSTFLKQYLPSFQDLDYDDYDGATPQYEFRLDTVSFRSAKDFKTIVIGNETDGKYNIIYIHGGAWSFQIAQEHFRFIEDVSDMFASKVYVPLYPMLPRWNHAEAFEMLLELYGKLLQQGKPVIIIGDSAGGNIVLGFTFHLKQLDYALPSYLIALSPAVDLTSSNPRIDELDPVDIYIDKTCIPYVGPLWAGDLPLEDATISPLFGDPTGFPPILLYIGDCEILYPDVISFAELCASKGVRTTAFVGRGLWHVAPLSDIPMSTDFKNLMKSLIEKN